MPLSTSTPEPTFARANQNPVHPGFAQYVDEVPSAPKVSVLSPRLQLTSGSQRTAFSRVPVVASHTLNIPFREGLFSVSRIYKILESAAFNWQREHQDAFFDQYSQLVLVSSSEKDQQQTWTTEYMRRNYKKFCKRVAHYWYHYAEARKLYTASLLNLLTLSKLNGLEPFGAFGLTCKWGYINTASKLYSRFPVEPGLEAAMVDASKWAVGSTTYGANIYSFPLWNMDIFGNRGFHSVDFTALFSQMNPTLRNQGEPGTECIELDDSSTAIADKAIKLMNHISDAMYQYVYGVKKARSVRIENGAAQLYDPNTSAEKDSDYVSIAKLNLDSNSFTNAISAAATDKDKAFNSQVYRACWDSFLAWQKYLIVHFPEMMDENNDLYTVAANEFKLFVPASQPENLLKAIRDLPTCSITDLASKMEYKKGNAPVTATLVKYCPPLLNDNTKNPYNGGSFYDTSVFTDNFERFEVDNPSTPDMLQKAQAWPHITPSVFPFTANDDDGGNSTSTPFVLNGSFTPGNMIRKDDESVAIMGKDAEFFDLTCCTNLLAENSYVEAYGVDSKYALDYVVACNAKLFEEYPTQPFVMQQPLIDNTDLYQCGFSVVLSADSKAVNEWENHFKLAENYNQFTKTSKLLTVVTNGDSFLLPSLDKRTDIAAYYMHASVSQYLERVRHALVFVGGAIFNHPWLRFTAPETGLPTMKFRVVEGDKEAAFEKFVDSMISAAGAPTDVSAWDQVYKIWFHSADHSLNLNVQPKDVASPQANFLFADILNHLKGSSTAPNANVQFEQYVFDPTYGAVQPIVTQMPSAAYAAYKIGATIAGKPLSSDEQNTFKALTPKLGSNYFADGDGVFTSPDDQNNTKKGAAYAQMDSAAMLYVYFIRAFGQKFCTLEDKTFLLREGPTDSQFSCEDEAKWPLTLTAISRVEFPGVEDMDNFWNYIGHVDLKTTMSLDVASSGSLPSDAVMITPRRAPKTIEAARSITSRGGSSLTDKSESNMAAESFGSKSEPKRPLSHENERSAVPEYAKSGSGKRKHSKSRKGGSKPASLDTTSSMSDDKGDGSKMTSSSFDAIPDGSASPVKDGGKNSYATKSSKKEFDDRKKRQVDGVSLQND